MRGDGEKRTAADGAGAAIGHTPTAVILENPSILADIAVALLEPGDDQKTRRSGSKSGSGRWAHWDEIGWVHYPEIGWSHSDEIRRVQSREILHIIAAGTHEALHVMRSDPQIASRFEQMELPVWTKSDELRRFVAGYLAMLPIRRDVRAIDEHFIQYLMEVTDGVTGRIIDLLRRAAINAAGNNRKPVTIDQLLAAGAALPAIVNQHVSRTLY